MPRKYFGCKISGCKRPHEARGYCKMHYGKWFYRTKHGLPSDLESLKICLHRELRPGTGPKGKRNGNWKGGIAQYPNHYELKKNRLVVLKRANYICRVCGEKATEVHHIDKSKNNHKIENLLAVCHKCNCNFHRDVLGRPVGSKNKKIELALVS